MASDNTMTFSPSFAALINGAKAADQENDNDRRGDADGDDPQKKGDAKKAKKAKADDEDGDEEMHGDSAAASARRRERARCAAIFGAQAAGRNPALAASLAFNTAMSRKEAIGVLETTSSTSTGLPNRAAGKPSSTWDAAFKRVAPRR